MFCLISNLIIKHQEQEWLNNQGRHPFSSLKPNKICKGTRSKSMNINLNQICTLFCSHFLPNQWRHGRQIGQWAGAINDWVTWYSVVIAQDKSCCKKKSRKSSLDHETWLLHNPLPTVCSSAIVMSADFRAWEYWSKREERKELRSKGQTWDSWG